jgi:predicted Zn-dependent protease with MMP-like domain
LTLTAFEQLVEQALRRIPRRFRERLRIVAIGVELHPPQPGLLGLYEGRPLPERSVSEPYAFPDRITIFMAPHLRLARDARHLRQIVEDTVWHEVAHYFGLNEAEVLRAERRRTLARRRGSDS